MTAKMASTIIGAKIISSIHNRNRKIEPGFPGPFGEEGDNLLLLLGRLFPMAEISRRHLEIRQTWQLIRVVVVAAERQTMKTRTVAFRRLVR